MGLLNKSSYQFPNRTHTAGVQKLPAALFDYRVISRFRVGCSLRVSSRIMSLTPRRICSTSFTSYLSEKYSMSSLFFSTVSLSHSAVHFVIGGWSA